MAEIVLYHHIQGLTDGIAAFAEELRGSGHTVHVPDMFEGRTFGSIEEGFACAGETGFDTIRQRGVADTPESSSGLVYAGFSFGVTIAQRLAQTQDDARDLADSAPSAELFVYPGDQHLFADSSLVSFDAGATELLLERVREFFVAI
ncbi:dienelactone hydrolase family protein [Brevibacterium sp. UCMA 11754]|uniref:dienelactone hydrolase family protein n=1 Tax=Brevibacterium sp. UCMA 11754 TaxID=2749198 RepID=UPI001F23AE73|nr:dienelactone hydrolase [Brevibacterium sp. UCMA 11754]MCF2571367.1 dienelactone hydrolase [Brevibacterium sp. UCMA 11754]